MFCPKCGSQNADETKFCRGCGADVGNVLAAVSATPISYSGGESKSSRKRTIPSAFHLTQLETEGEQTIAEKRIELSSSGWRGLLVGSGFLIVAGLAFGISERLAVLGIFLLTFTVVFIGTGISRFVQARGLKRLLDPSDSEHGPALTAGEADYIQPFPSLFATDDLTGEPRSATEHTTTRLGNAADRKS